jgi:cysteine-rich repeat protein
VAAAPTDRGADQRPQLATDGAGTWIVVWTANDGTRGGDLDVLRARSTDGGVTWTAPAALNANAAADTGLDDRPQIATDGQGTWVAAWVSDNDLGGAIGNDLDVLTTRSTDGGATWSAPAPLNGNAATDTGADGAPSLVTDRHGTWVAVWESNESVGSDTAIMMAHSLDAGAHWSAPQALDPAYADDQRRDVGPQLATDGRGMWNAVWTGIGGTLGTDGDVLRSGGRERCGNGTVDPGEQCDDGNTLGGDACPANCEFPPPPTPLATWTPPGSGGTAGAGTPTPGAGGATPSANGTGANGATPSGGTTPGAGTSTSTATAVDPNATPVVTTSPDPAATQTATVDPAATATPTVDASATTTPSPTASAPTGTSGPATGTPNGPGVTPTASGGPQATASSGPQTTATGAAHATATAPVATPTPAPPRFAGGLGDALVAKAAVACQRAVVKAGAQLIGTRLAGFGACGRGVQHCIQTQPGDAACLAKAAARCQSVLRALETLDVKTAAALHKRCGGRLRLADVLSAAGLGYAAFAPECGEDGDLDDLIACVVGEHACRAGMLFEMEQPRAKEMMRLPGMNASMLDTVVCLPDHGGDGETLGDPTGAGKAVDLCAGAIVKAGTGFVRKRLARLARCMDGLFTCVQLKPNDGACLAKARARCDAGDAASTVEERALTSAVAARCNESVVAYASLRAARAANLDALADACRRVGVPALDTLADYQQCLLRADACRVEGVVRLQAPRMAELLGLVGRRFGGDHCEAP